MTWLCNHVLRPFLHRFRVNGTKKLKPSASVKNPGVKSSKPPIRTKAPSIKVIAGICPCEVSSCILRRISTPWLRASQAPAMPVSMMRPIVGPRPIIRPASISMYNSISGTNMKIMSNFINTVPRLMVVCLCHLERKHHSWRVTQ